MVRILATTSLVLIVLAAFAALAGARADYPYSTPALCEETPALAPGLGGTRDSIIGGHGSTGPTFPSVCKQAAAATPLPPRWRKVDEFDPQ